MSIKKKESPTAIVVHSQKPTLQAFGQTVSDVLSYVEEALHERRSERLTELDKRLKELEDTGAVFVDSLRGNEGFIDLVNNAISLSIKTSATEKIRALQNAILNAALGNVPDNTTSQVFLNLIDSFTPLHLQILHLYHDPAGWFTRNNKTAPNLMMGSLHSVVFAAFPDLKDKKDLLDVIWSDLLSAGLHRTSELGVSMSGSGLLTKRTSALGDAFLEFIAENGKA